MIRRSTSIVRVVIWAVATVVVVILANEQGCCADSRRDVFPLAVKLQPKRVHVTVGRRFDVEISMRNRSDRAIEVFDAKLDRRLQDHAMALVILGPDGSYIGDHLARGGRSGSMRLPHKSDWANLNSGDKISAKVAFTAGDVPTADQIEPASLPPGKYFLELRVFDRALSGLPAGMKEETSGSETLKLPSFQRWRFGFPGNEVVRSNRMELQILARTGD